ncbi:hypothetical protein JW898_01670 [Candidatus Woesearchaeota archaeon]|nr:hypothetical protein [Candidatus Woesearchaeota archaeon]
MSLVHDDCPEDVAFLEAINALCYVKEFDGGGSGESVPAIARLPVEALDCAVDRGWLERQQDMYVITREGERIYDENIRFGGCRPAVLIEEEPDVPPGRMRASDGMRIAPQEHTIYHMPPECKER